METETLGTRLSFSDYSMSPKNSIPESDLHALIGSMKHIQSWRNEELNSLVLLNSPGRQIVLTALHEDTEISSFQSGDSVTFQIVEGKIKFRTRKASIFLNKGQELTLHENVKYTLTSMEDSVFFLTISGGNS
jgi:hypothetical protein